MRFNDLTGQELKGWLFLHKDPNDLRKHKRRWICKHLCCGNLQSLLYYQLYTCDVRCKYCFKQKFKFRFNSAFYKALKKAAKTRKLDFNVSKEYLLDLLNKQQYKCAISGVEIWIANTTAGHQEKRQSTASLDRINSDFGYIEGNVQWVHKTVNKIKWNFTEQEFLWWITNIVGNNLEKIANLEIDDPLQFLCRKHTSGRALTESEIQEIREDYLSLELTSEIAKKFNVSKTTILYHTKDLIEKVKEMREKGEFWLKNHPEHDNESLSIS